MKQKKKSESHIRFSTLCLGKIKSQKKSWSCWHNPSIMEQKTFLTVALEAAQAAEKIIMDYFINGKEWTRKMDLSPVTIADIESEKMIKKIIRSHFPDHGFIGEEGWEENETSNYKWIIDPIDGTKNYTRKIPLFATLIGLMYKDEIILWVSNAPAMWECLWAEKWQGAFCNGKKITVSSLEKIEETYCCFGGIKYFAKDGKINALLKLNNLTLGQRGIGDFWCYNLLAQGKIDIMTEARVKFWDIAAVKVIVEEAGGKCTDIFWAPITQKSIGIIATNGKLHHEVVQIFNN